jgi:hypothetical protein
MSFRSGNKSDAKKIMLRLPPERQSKELYALDRAQVKALLTLAETIGWATRHISLPEWITSPDELQSFADETIKDLMNPLDMCQLMQDNAACFVSSDEFDDALGDTINVAVSEAIGDDLEDTINRATRKLPSGLSGTNLLAGTDCDFDRIYNVIVHVVDFLDDITMTLFAGLEALTNPVERAKSFLELVNAKTGIDLGALIDIGNDLVDNVQESYSLDYSGDTRQDIICDIFCLFRDDCELPFWKLNVYYANKFNTDINEASTPWDILNTISDFFLSGQIPGDLVVYAMHSLALSVINSNVPFMGEDFFSFAQVVKAAEDTGDNDWIEFCEDCPADLGITDWVFLDPSNFVPFTTQPEVTYFGSGHYEVTTPDMGYDYSYVLAREGTGPTSIGGYFNIYSAANTTGGFPSGGTLTPPSPTYYWYAAWQHFEGPQTITFDADVAETP